jgi:histidinol-phosphate aminotransferase
MMATTRPDVSRLLRRDLTELAAYAAPEPLDEFARRLGIQPADVAKLDQNENPYGCSPKVQAALANYSWYHVYPDPEHRVLRDRIADYAGVPPEHIVVGNGSDELLELTLRLFVEPGDRVLSASPTFGFYSTVAFYAGAEYVTVPRGPTFEVDVDVTRKGIDGRTKVVLVASPNNPTGNLTGRETIAALLELGLIVVVDEAYYEFAGQTAVDWFRERQPENLIVLRTFSKWAGLAGLRLGYGIYPARIAELLRAYKPPYSVGQAAEVAGLASLDDVDYLKSTVQRIVSERARLSTALTETGLFRPYPSEANFVFADVVGRPPVEVQRHLAERAILVRRYVGPRLDQSLRISVGRPEHTDRLLTALGELR